MELKSNTKSSDPPAQLNSIKEKQENKSTKMEKRINNLEQSLLFWQEKCVDLRFEEHKLKLLKESWEKEKSESQEKTIQEIQKGSGKVLEELNELKESNAVLTEEIDKAKQNAAHYRHQIEVLAKVPKKHHLPKDPTRFVEAARTMNLGSLSWVTYQVWNLLSKQYPYMGPGAYQYPPSFNSFNDNDEE